MTTPPWKASGAPLNWSWFTAAVSALAPRLELKSSITSKLSTIANAPIARWATIHPLTSNSKTTNQMIHFHCPFFRGKPKNGEQKGEGDGATNIILKHNFLSQYGRPEHRGSEGEI